MADHALLAVPAVAAKVAIWAAQEGRDDALARADAAAKLLYDTGAWGFVKYASYDASFTSTRVEFWRSGQGDLDALLDAPLLLQAEELYAELYPGLVTSWPVLRGMAVAAANKGNAALALLRGRQAAKAATAAKAWTLIDYSFYVAATDPQRVAFWASGGKVEDLPTMVPPGQPAEAPAPAPAPIPAPSSSGLGAFIVAGLVLGGVWWWKRS